MLKTQNNKKTNKNLSKNLVCRLKPEKPRLRINSEDIDTGPPNANQTVNIQKSSITTNSNRTINTTTDNKNANKNPTQFSNTKDIVTIAVAATETANNAKSLASYCQYDSVDLESIDIDTAPATNPFSTTASTDRNPAKILDECDLKYDTTAITSI